MAAPSRPLDILFLTNFSDYCFRVIPSIAQLMDCVSVRLTLMHVYDPARTTAEKAADDLQSFFPEGDRYRTCRRVAVPGPLLEAVRRHLDAWPVNLIVAPASDPIGIPRIGDRSLRAQLLEACGVPIWTMGRGVRPVRLTQPIRHVACWLDFHADRHKHLPFAIEYARSLGARLHLLRGLPSIDEGLLLPPGHPDRALHPDRAVEEIAEMCARSSIEADVHVGHGDGRRTMARLLEQCQADIVFLRNEERLVSRWLGLGLGLRLGDKAPCPSVYVSERPSIPIWNLEPARRPRPHAIARDVMAARERVAVGQGRTPMVLPGLVEIGLP